MFSDDSQASLCSYIEVGMGAQLILCRESTFWDDLAHPDHVSLCMVIEGSG